jgi:hypothetical protein
VGRIWSNRSSGKLTDLERRQILTQLIGWQQPIDHLATLMSSVPWDSDSDLVTLTSAHILDVLDRFVVGTCSAADIERWANLIECREDIAHQTAEIAEAIHVLANPLLMGALTPDLAQELRSSLSPPGQD